MGYDNGLKALRAKLLSGATGREAPVERGMESLIPARATAEPQQESTEDILSRGATWLSDIRGSAEVFKRQYEAGRPKGGGAGRGLADAADTLARGLSAKVESKKEAERQAELAASEDRKASFIQRRGEDRPATYAPSAKGSARPIPLDAPTKSVLDAIAAVESKGSGDYAARGPEVKKGRYAGERAMGRYQVMPGNLPQWSKEALGKTITPEEFMASPEYQDTIAAHQLSKAKAKHGTWEDAASVWFSGQPLKTAGDVSDGYTTVPEYINKFRRSFVR